MQLVQFNYVDDVSNLYANTNTQDVSNNIKYSCGIYSFKKNN